MEKALASPGRGAGGFGSPGAALARAPRVGSRRRRARRCDLEGPVSPPTCGAEARPDGRPRGSAHYARGTLRVFSSRRRRFAGRRNGRLHRRPPGRAGAVPAGLKRPLGRADPRNRARPLPVLLPGTGNGSASSRAQSCRRCRSREGRPFRCRRCLRSRLAPAGVRTGKSWWLGSSTDLLMSCPPREACRRS